MRNVAPFLVVFIFYCLLATCQAAAAEPCEGQKNTIVVDTAQHRLWTCREDNKVGGFSISIGRGGIDKQKQGDEKTPLGEYPLGTPRLSVQFGIFIPIGYPTPEQKAKGFTGSDVGIHGPSRTLRLANKWFDWTQGCIAVETDTEISEIARWVKEQNINRIVIK